jgi:hypothetical protein
LAVAKSAVNIHSEAGATTNLPDGCVPYVKFLTDTPHTYAQITSLKLSKCFTCSALTGNLPVLSLHIHPLWTRQTTYVWRNIEATSCNHVCGGKTISLPLPYYITTLPYKR